MNPARITKTAIVFFLLTTFPACAPKPGDTETETETRIPTETQAPADTPDTAGAPPAAPEIRYVSASEGLILRAGPSTATQRKTVLPEFTQLTVISRGDSPEHIGGKTGFWLEVFAMGKTGWVFGGETTEQPVPRELFTGEWFEEPRASAKPEEKYEPLYDYSRDAGYVFFGEDGSYREEDPQSGMESYGSWTYNGSELAREIRSRAQDGTGREIRNDYSHKVFFEGRDRFFIKDYRGTWLRRRGGELSPGQKDLWGRTPLMYAAAHGDSELVSALVNQGAALAGGDIWNRTPLFYAAGAREGAGGVTQELVERGADPNSRSKAGRTPLMYALINENTEAALALLAAGADRSIKDNDGNTALHLFCRHVRSSAMTRVLEKLLEGGADINALNNESLSPLDMTMLNRREKRTFYELDISNYYDFKTDEYGDSVRELLKAAGARYSTPEKQREAEPHNLIIPAGTKEIGKGEYAGKDLFTLSLPQGLESIGIEAFAGNFITSLTVPGSVTTMGIHAFRGNWIHELILEDGLTAIGRTAFLENPLRSVVFPKTLTFIDTGAFMECALETLVLPDNITRIGSLAFYKNSLRELKLSRNLKEIPFQAFSRNRLSAVELPPSVQTIEVAAFSYNPLTTVTIGANLEFLERIPPGEGPYRDDEYTFGTYGAAFFRDYNANGKKAGTYIYNQQTKTWICRP